MPVVAGIFVVLKLVRTISERDSFPSFYRSLYRVIARRLDLDNRAMQRATKHGSAKIADWLLLRRSNSPVPVRLYHRRPAQITASSRISTLHF